VSTSRGLTQFNQQQYEDVLIKAWLDYLERNDRRVRQGSLRGINILLRGLLPTSNIAPPSDAMNNQDVWNTFVHGNEYRGFLFVKPRLTCDCNDQPLEVHWRTWQHAGYTPARFGPDAEGRSSAIAYPKGEQGPSAFEATVHPLYSKCALLSVWLRTRAGKSAQHGFEQLVGLGMPWVWTRIDYHMCCNGQHRVEYYGSIFPTQVAFYDGKAVMVMPQSARAFAALVFAGDAIDMPGRRYHDTGWLR
jgi:hypothetical protein